MSELINTSSRQLIPRWHTSRKLNLIQEFDDNNLLQVEDGSKFEIDEKEQRWKEEPSISSASELFVSLKLAGLESSELCANVQKFLQAHNDDLSVSTRRLVSPELKMLDASDSYSTSRDSIVKIIGALKSIVRELPQDSLSWNDLAFYYAGIGEIEKAHYCMSIASNLNPDHPFLARSYARFLVHVGEYDKALYVLKKTNRLNSNPEILSADIAIRSEFEIGKPKITLGRKLVDSFDEWPQFVSELAASIGTIEIKNGALRKGKNLLTKAGISPTENTVAQLKWLSHNHNVVVPVNLGAFESLEAKANADFYSKDFLSCRDSLVQMHNFQPFSESAIIDAGYISLVHLKDVGYVLKNLNGINGSPLKGFNANNNLLVAKMHSGDFRDIDKSLSKLSQLAHASRVQRDQNIAVYSATLGMYSYHCGMLEEARALYSKAENYFRSKKMSFNTAIALLYQGLEEKKLDKGIGNEILRRAIGEAKKSANGLVLLDRLESEME